MSTLTLAVNDYFKPDLAPKAEVGAVASPVSQNYKPTQNLHFQTDQSYTFAKLTPDLTANARPGLTPFRSLPVDTVTLAPRSWPSSEDTVISVQQNVKSDAHESARKFIGESENAENAGTESAETAGAGSGKPQLRKLKSSLKLPKLTKLYSTSNLSPKLVRFASRLENVKMFNGKDSPSTVSLQNTPVGSPNAYNFDLSDYFSSHRNFTDLGLSDLDSDLDSDTFVEYTKDKLYRVSSSNFSAPKNIYDKQNSPVYLQQMTMGTDKKSLVLMVMCQNLAFEKQISVKLTYNNWQSTLIFNSSSHVKSFSSVNFDQFKFVIPLSHLPSLISAQFCLRYEVNGQTYWDNNSGRNYNVVFSSYVKPHDSFTYKTPTFATPEKHTHTPTINIASEKIASPHNYDELISKLMSVSAKPLHHSASLPALRPRYSQSFREKTGKPQAQAQMEAQAPAKAQTQTQAPAKTQAQAQAQTQAQTQKFVAKSNVALPLKQATSGELVLTKPASFQDSKFNSVSYATLLQTYCFNGSSDNSATGSLASSRQNLSSSLDMMHQLEV